MAQHYYSSILSEKFTPTLTLQWNTFQSWLRLKMTVYLVVRKLSLELQ